MKRIMVMLFGVFGLAAVLVAGCGRPTLPGQQLSKEEEVGPPQLVATDTPLPDKPFQEWGPSNAKVRLLAFYPIDDPHQAYLDLLKEVSNAHPGKVYVKYVDYRTPEGAGMFSRAGASVACILINSENSYTMTGPHGPYTVDFVREMGRYWTEDDLRAAVDDAVKKAYGK